jgi:hypothetical protein
MAKSKKTVKKVSTVKPVTVFELLVFYPDNLCIRRKIEDTLAMGAKILSCSSWSSDRVPSFETEVLSFIFFTYAEASAAAKRAEKVNRKITTSITVWGD